MHLPFDHVDELIYFYADFLPPEIFLRGSKWQHSMHMTAYMFLCGVTSAYKFYAAQLFNTAIHRVFARASIRLYLLCDHFSHNVIMHI